jgi:hypothetical protein
VCVREVCGGREGGHGRRIVVGRAWRVERREGLKGIDGCCPSWCKRSGKDSGVMRVRDAAFVLLFFAGVVVLYKTATHAGPPSPSNPSVRQRTKLRQLPSIIRRAEQTTARRTPSPQPSPVVAAFTVSNMGTDSSWEDTASVHVSKDRGVLSSFWNARVLEGQAWYNIVATHDCKILGDVSVNADTQEIRRCSVSRFVELFDGGHERVIYIDEAALLGYRFNLSNLDVGAGPVTIVQQKNHTAMVVIKADGWPRPSGGVGEFLEEWLESARKVSFEQSLSLACDTFHRHHPSFIPQYRNVRGNVVLGFNPAITYEDMAEVIVHQLQLDRVLREAPREPADQTRPYHFTKKQQRRRRNALRTGKRVAFTFANYNLREHPWALPVFLWNRMVLWRRERLDMRMYTGQCQRHVNTLIASRSSRSRSTGLSPHLDPHWCRVWIFDHLFLNEGVDVALYVDADLLLRLFYSTAAFIRETNRYPEQTRFKTRKNQMPAPASLLDRDVLHIIGKSEYGEVAPNSGMLLFIRPSRTIFALWKESYDGDIWDQRGLVQAMEKHPMTYRISPYRSLWTHYSSALKDGRLKHLKVVDPRFRDCRILRSMMEFAIADTGPWDSADQVPLITRQSMGV